MSTPHQLVLLALVRLVLHAPDSLSAEGAGRLREFLVYEVNMAFKVEPRAWKSNHTALAAPLDPDSLKVLPGTFPLAAVVVH